MKSEPLAPRTSSARCLSAVVIGILIRMLDLRVLDYELRPIEGYDLPSRGQDVQVEGTLHPVVGPPDAPPWRDLRHSCFPILCLGNRLEDRGHGRTLLAAVVGTKTAHVVQEE